MKSVENQPIDRGRFVARTQQGKAPLTQQYFAPSEIGTYMGVSTYHVQDLCRGGELRHVKVGRRIRIRLEWADAYMAAREREPLR
jgi:excisionase family DNA binding protein